jgi:hypothetical protein
MLPDPGVLAVMPRALADLCEAQPAQQLADRPLVVVDAEAAPDQRLQAVRFGVRASLDGGRELGVLVRGQSRRSPRRPPSPLFDAISQINRRKRYAPASGGASIRPDPTCESPGRLGGPLTRARASCPA